MLPPTMTSDPLAGPISGGDSLASWAESAGARRRMARNRTPKNFDITLMFLIPFEMRF
jgi:hypothetical protein